MGYLLLTTGMRASELLSLRFLDVHQENYNYIEIKGKRDKWRRIPLSHKAIRLIKNLEKILLIEKIDSSYICFNVSNPKQHITYEALRNITQRTVEIFTDKRTPPHWFRRAFITKLLEQGEPLYKVMKISGHESISTTNSYLQDNQDELGIRIPFE